jgi:transglutaminase-like putative cysteine protease
VSGPRPAPAVARLAVFAAFAAFAAAHWAGLLLTDPPVWRVVLVVAAAIAVGAALAALLPLRDRSRALVPLAVLAALAAATLALLAAGIPAGHLWPGGWDELAADLDRGIAGLAGDVEYPYRGANEWTRIAILAGLALSLALAAALAFWPASGRHAIRFRFLALAALVALFVAAVAANEPPAPFARGLVLLALLAAWLWLPALRRRGALAAAAAVAVAALAATPLALALDSDEPWLRYREWRLARAQTTAFNWNHGYDVIGWPRDGRAMLEVRSDRARYWRASILDEFDGDRWERSEAPFDSPVGTPDAPSFGTLGSAALAQAHPEWIERTEFVVGAIESELLFTPGLPLAVEGLGEVSAADDGTAQVDDGLTEGDGYQVLAYVPDPSVGELRAAPAAYPPELARYTRFWLPGPPSLPEAGPASLRPAERVQVPLRGSGVPTDQVRRRLAAFPYGRLHRLARRLTAGAPTTYDAVAAVERHLERSYSYSEDPPYATFPLAAFVGRDRVGYCQQFSGAMGLMLRSIGIPARVVSGFAPGTPDLDRERVYQVDDFDAHSWVEVYFSGIGWVTFDPTPAASPATTGAPADTAAVAERGRLGLPPIGSGRGTTAPVEPAEEPGGGGDPYAELIGATLAALVLAAALATLARRRAHRHRDAAAAREAQLAELAGALGRLGQQQDPGATLLAIERRLASRGHRQTARYVGRLRAGRYEPHGPPPPTLSERRAVRRELAGGRGLGPRVRGLRAIPPGGPARRRV